MLVYNGIKYVNKRPMGHIAHLRNQFKSININFEKSYDYILTIMRRGKPLGPVVLEKKKKM